MNLEQAINSALERAEERPKALFSGHHGKARLPDWRRLPLGGRRRTCGQPATIAPVPGIPPRSCRWLLGAAEYRVRVVADKPPLASAGRRTRRRILCSCLQRSSTARAIATYARTCYASDFVWLEFKPALRLQVVG